VSGKGGKNASAPVDILTPLPAPHQLEEVILPDGSVAYIKKADKAKVDESSKLKKTDKTSATAATGAPSGIPMNESAMGHGHCSVCCPSAPKTNMGQPVQPCAHQDGPTVVAPGGPPGVGANKPGAANITKPAPGGTTVVTPAPAAVPDVNVTDVNNIGSGPEDTAGQGKKGGKPIPVPIPGGAGPAMSGEQKMEEARNLAGEA
jgi:hypothetical protein